MDQNASDEASCCSSSNMFTVKVVIAWLIICLPGNIFAIVCIYGTEGSDITSSHQKQTNFSDGNFVNFSLRSQQNYSNFYWNQKFITRHLKTDQESFIQTSNETHDRFDVKDFVNISKYVEEEASQCYETFEEDLETGRKRIRFWIEGVGIFVVGVIGFPCNLITVFVLRRYCMRRKNKNFNILIMCLTIADTVLIIDIMWQKSVVQHFLSPAEPEWYEKTYPTIWHPLKGISLSGTIFMTLAVSTERFRSVCSPMKLKISPFKYIATVVSASIVSKIHRFFQFELTEDGKNYQLGKLMESPAYIRFNAYWDEMAVSGFIPLFILIYLNLKIYLEIRSSKKMESCRHRGRSQFSEKSLGLIATTSKIPIILAVDRHSATTVNMDTATVHKIRRSSSFVHREYRNSLDHSRQSYRTVPLMSSKNFYEFEVDHLNIQHSSTHIENTFLEGSYNKELAIKGKEKKDGGESTFPSHRIIDCYQKTRMQRNDNIQLSRHSQISGGLSNHNSLQQEQSENKRSIMSQTSEEMVRSIMSQTSEEIVSKRFTRKGEGKSLKRLSMDKSTLILIIIVTFFIITHSTRMASKLYMTIFPQFHTEENFMKCLRRNRYHVPFVLYILNHLNSILIVLSSSLNFIIYCCVAKGFRKCAVGLFSKTRHRRNRNVSSLYA